MSADYDVDKGWQLGLRIAAGTLVVVIAGVVLVCCGLSGALPWQNGGPVPTPASTAGAR